ncbi:MAG: VCBS domain-containing protein, partial [Methyloligellaceae bacterium]
MARSESESGGSVATLHATGGTIEVPDAQLLFTATFLKSGQDLILLGADGSKLIIVGYFAGEELALLLAPNGASLLGETVRLLAGPEFPGQYAQAGGPAGAEPIGQVETASGTVTVQRANGVILQLKVGDPVFEDDIVITGQNSAVGISFTDETLFSLLADTRMVLDKHVYDPNGSSNSMLFDVIQGTFSVVAGKIAPTGDMLVRTPIATIGVRGTEYGGKNLVQADGAEGKLFVLTGTINILNNLTLQVIQTVSDPSIVIAGAQGGDVDIQQPSGEDRVEIQQIATQLQGVKSQFQSRKEQQGDTDQNTDPNQDGDPGAAPDGKKEGNNAPNTNNAGEVINAATETVQEDAPEAETTITEVALVDATGDTEDTGPIGPEFDNNDQIAAAEADQASQIEDTSPPPVPEPDPPTVTEGADFVVGSPGNDTIDALGGNDIISGNAGNDILSGGAGNDIVDGGVGDDVITGGTGDDTLTGGDGNDTISGNEGNDTIILGFGAGNDTADGGPDNDTAIYTSTVNGVIVNLETGEARSVIPDDPSTPENESEIDTDTLIDIENVVGGSGNDIITGTGGANILAGLDGNDRLDGNGGADILSGGTGDDTLVISEDAAFVLEGGEGTDTVLFAGGLNLNTQETTGDATSIEIIDLNTTDTNRFELAAEDVEVISGATPLRILGGPTQGGSETDTVVLNATFDGVPDGVWQQVAADVVIDGVLFDTYQFVEGSTAFATVHIAQGINVEAPPLALPDDEATDEDSAVIIDVLANDDDPDGSNANLFVASFDATGVQGTVTLNANDTFTYDPGAAFQGLAAGEQVVETFTYVLEDEQGLQDVGTATVTITGVNDTAVIGGVSTGDVTEDDDPATLATGGLLTITDVDAGEAEFVAQASTAGSNGFGTFTLDTAGNWTYAAVNTQLAIQSLADGDTLTDSFTAVSSDGSASQLVTVTITGVNDTAAIGGVSTGDVTEDDDPATLATGGLLTITDVDAGEAEFVAQVSTAGSNGVGTFTLDTSGNWTYSAVNSQLAIQSLADGETIADSFTAVSEDGSASQLVTVTITGLNDEPTATAIVETISEDVANFSVDLFADANADDVDAADTLDTLSVVNPDATIVTTGGRTLLRDTHYTVSTAGPAPTFALTAAGLALFADLAASQADDFTFNYEISDGTVSIPNTLDVTVDGANDPPVAQDDDAATNEDAAVSGNVLTNDSDVDDGFVLTVTEVNGVAADVGTEVTLASGAQLTLNSDGSFIYDPNGAFDTLQGIESGAVETDTDSFDYT